MAYTAEKPGSVPDRETLRNTIPGWGVDLDFKDRPVVPKESFRRDLTGAHWHMPEQQPQRWPREKSTEHARLTPVFGTSCPPKGLSGVLRKFAYTLSEGRVSHWLLLMAADRVDVVESRVTGLLSGRPDNLIGETGIMAEFTHKGYSSRVGQHRSDLKHQAIDPFLQVGTILLAGGIAFMVGRAVVGANRSIRRR